MRSIKAGVQEVRIRSVLTCETTNGVCGTLLRARSRARHAGQHRRGGRRHRGAVDRRAGHAAHHAHVPHRRRGADLRAVVHRVELRRHDHASTTAMSCATRTASSSPWRATWRSSSSTRTARERAVHRIQFGARLKVDEGDKIKRGQRIAEWDPYTRPILTEVDGIGRFRGPGRRPVDDGDARRDRPASPSAWSSTGAPARRGSAGPAAGHRHQGQGRQGAASSRAAARRATCSRSTRSSRSIRAAW